MKSVIQKFEIQRVDRASLKNAPYNPRKIKKTNKESLGKAIDELGLLEPLVWNKRTGNLVSGHKRLEIIDLKTGHFDYQLDVAVVDLSEKNEAKANIALNNRALQGDFDFPKLKDMALEFDLDLSDDILDIKTAFTEFLDLDLDTGYEDFDDEGDQYTPDKVPLAIVLTSKENELWESVKSKVGFRTDTKAFNEVIKFYCEKKEIQ